MTKTDGVAPKSRASCGYTHKVVLLGTPWYQLVVIIHYETISICYLYTNCSYPVRFIIGASSLMVSWLTTYDATAKLRAPCECTRKVLLLSACWYQGL
jgi:hypothetical protein